MVVDLWIDWTGGECPLSPETSVQIKLRNERTLHGLAMHFRWDWQDIGSDIIAYYQE